MCSLRFFTLALVVALTSACTTNGGVSRFEGAYSVMPIGHIDDALDD